jgi:hypothetical protein
VNNNDFGEDITSKLYLKYHYKAVSKGLKSVKKEAFSEIINGSFSDHLYNLNPLRKKNWCFFCLKKSIKRAEKERKSEDLLFQRTF